jgi:hypothetical protein
MDQQLVGIGRLVPVQHFADARALQQSGARCGRVQRLPKRRVAHDVAQRGDPPFTGADHQVRRVSVDADIDLVDGRGRRGIAHAAQQLPGSQRQRQRATGQGRRQRRILQFERDGLARQALALQPQGQRQRDRATAGDAHAHGSARPEAGGGRRRPDGRAATALGIEFGKPLGGAHVDPLPEVALAAGSRCVDQ